jgi:hypothetical protein
MAQQVDDCKLAALKTFFGISSVSFAAPWPAEYTCVMPLIDDLSMLVGTEAGTTFTGGANRTYIDKDDGLLKTVLGANVPRFEAEGLLMEGPSHNYCLQSSTMATSPWSDQNGVTSVNNAAIGPDGQMSASVATYGLGASEAVVQNIQDPSQLPGILSFWGRVDVTRDIRITLDAQTTIQTITPVWTRYTIPYTPVAALIELRVRNANDPPVAGPVEFFGFQWEEVSIATSYIATTVATVPRVVEVLGIPASNVPATSLPMSVGLSVTSLGLPIGAVTQTYYRSTGETDLNRLYSAPAGTNFLSDIAGNSASGVIGKLVDVTYRAVTTEEVGTLTHKIYVDTVEEDAVDGLARAGAISSFNIACQADGLNPSFCHVTNLRIFNVALDQAGVDEEEDFFPAAGSPTGQVNDLEVLYVQDLLAARYPIEPELFQLSDLWQKLFELDASKNNRNDGALAWLPAEGAIGDSVTDLWHDYWCRVMGGGETNDFDEDFGPDFP